MSGVRQMGNGAGRNELALMAMERALVAEADRCNAGFVRESGWNSPNAGQAPRFNQFIELFGDRGVLGHICDPDYNAFFQEAVSKIRVACEDFIPPG